MRMEELNDNNYIKGTDSVERYLLDIIKSFFNSAGIDQEASKEYVIKKAVERMKEELVIDNAGVVTVNGKTGVVTITLKDLGGEPLIVEKKTAFNVDFGTEAGTAAKGDDPRLNNSRRPLPHRHDISEINGLEGQLSSINTKADKVSGLGHKHENGEVLAILTYTGSKPVIDLTLLDTLEQDVLDVSNDIGQRISDLQTLIASKAQEADDLSNNYASTIEELYRYADNEDDALETLLINKIDTDIQTLSSNLSESMINKVEVSEVNEAINILNYTFSHIGEEEINLNSFLTIESSGVITHTHTVSQEIDDAISELNILNCQFETYLQYTDPDTSKLVTTQLPFIEISNNAVNCIVSVDVINNKNISIKVSATDIVPAHIQSAKLIYRVFAVKDVPLITR